MGMFLLPWGTGARSEKTTVDTENIPVPIRTPRPVSQMSSLNKMKRKRVDSGGALSPRPDHYSLKKQALHISHIELPQQQGFNGSIPVPKQRAGSQTPGVMLADAGGAMEWEAMKGGESCKNESKPHGNMSPQEQIVCAAEEVFVQPDAKALTILRETIESQFNLEILLKHKELRLIEQEIAKCQAALEQLRRCQLIPYPAMTSKVEDMQAVSSGSGRTFDTRATHPPPWGVADGPYARHYEKWLIPDMAFDGIPEESPAPPRPAGKGVKILPERTTRGSISEKGISSSISRSQRGSNVRLQSLPHGYPEPKEDKGPMIVKRSTDGAMVKLVCVDCHRENFNSAQGFINHCRIAHNRQYASHEAAAINCGEVVDPSMVELSVTSSSTALGLVHPLIRSARSKPNTPILPFPPRKNSSVQTQADQAPVTPHRPAQFTPSERTPHLSAHVARIGFDGDLEELVNEVKTRVDVGADADSSSDEDQDHDQDHIMKDSFDSSAKNPPSLSTFGPVRAGCLPARATMSPAPLERSPSSKGIHGGARKPETLPRINPGAALYTSPYAAQTPEPSHPSRSGDSTHLLSSSTSPTTHINLSPVTPIESHPAPSLVSDDGDFDHTHSESPSSASDHEDQELEIEVEDADEAARHALEEGGPTSTSGATHHHHHHLGLTSGSVKSPHPQPRRVSRTSASSALRAPPPPPVFVAPPVIHHRLSGSSQHVSFANSPTRRVRAADEDDENDIAGGDAGDRSASIPNNLSSSSSRNKGAPPG